MRRSDTSRSAAPRPAQARGGFSHSLAGWRGIGSPAQARRGFSHSLAGWRSIGSPAQARGGFTLIELMISIGILGVGLAMAVSLFPAAIMENQQSANDILGSIMGENALAVVKAKIKANAANFAALLPDPNANPNFVWIGDPVLTEVDLAHPAPRDPNDPSVDPNNTFDGDWLGTSPNRPWTRRGCVVLARRMKADENDFQIVVVAFRKKGRINAVAPKALTVDITDVGDGETSLMTVTGGDAVDVKPDSPVIIIDPANPSVVHVARVSVIRGDGKAVLSRQVFPTPLVTDVSAWVIVEADFATDATIADIRTSPAISTLVVRTSLRQ